MQIVKEVFRRSYLEGFRFDVMTDHTAKQHRESN